MKLGQAVRILGLALVLGGSASAQMTRRISVSASGVQGDGASDYPSISADGRSVAFSSHATTLVGWDTNGVPDAYFRGWLDNYNELVSADTNENLANAPSYLPAISGDGRHVVFASDATNLVPGDTNGARDIFVRARSSGTTYRVSVSSSGVQANDWSFTPSISADSKYVVFESLATNLVPGDTNGVQDIFLRDPANGVTELISVASNGTRGNGNCFGGTISADGRYVAFVSESTNLVPGDTNGVKDVFVRDRRNGVTTRVSMGTGGVQANDWSAHAWISGDGHSVAFESAATNLLGWDTNGVPDIYYRAWMDDYTEIVSARTDSGLANNSSAGLSISADGRIVAFASSADNLVPGDTNGVYDVFVRNRSAGTTERVSLSSSGTQGNDHSYSPSISSDGRLVAFSSLATNLTSGDTNQKTDIYLRDRYVTGFTSLCHPGQAGVRLCPCGNAPSGAGRGCNNSAGTGGAQLTASGTAYLSEDSLVFTTFAERSTALSILLQGNALAASGIVYGQGVRCAGGSLKRLFTKNASVGSISVPDVGAGDPSVSSRSAAKGDTIQAGQSRWYLVYYRDPVVLGGCPASSTFNATQTGEIAWML